MSNQPSLPRIEILYSESEINTRVAALGEQITKDYTNEPLVVLVVLKGSFVFAADLIRKIDLPLRVEFLGLKSYGSDTVSSGVVQITQDLSSPINGENVLIVEDIVDTGLTMNYLLRQLTTRTPKSVRVCAFLHKPSRTIEPVLVDYLGFTIPDRFVVGYGLDHAQKYRNLPYLGAITESSSAA